MAELITPQPLEGGYRMPISTLSELAVQDRSTFGAVVTAQTLNWYLNTGGISNHLRYLVGLAGGLGCEPGALYRPHADVDLFIAQDDIWVVQHLADLFGQNVTCKGDNIYRVFVPPRKLPQIGASVEVSDSRFAPKIPVDFMAIQNNQGSGLFTCAYARVNCGNYPFPVENIPLLGLPVNRVERSVLKQVKEQDRGPNRTSRRFDLQLLERL